MSTTPQGRRWWPVALGIAACAVVPAPAAAGGTAVIAPPELRSADCVQGSPAPFVGVRSEPVGPTVIGCAGHGSDEVLVVVTRFDPPRPPRSERPQICFYVAPEGRQEVDGLCTTNRSRGGQAKNALSGEHGISGVRIRQPPTPDGSGRPARPLISGLASGVGRPVVRFRRADGTPAALPLPLLAVRARLAGRLGAEGPFAALAARLPADVDPCEPLTVVALGKGGNPTRPVEARFHGPPPRGRCDHAAADAFATAEPAKSAEPPQGAPGWLGWILCLGLAALALLALARTCLPSRSRPGRTAGRRQR